MNSTLRLLLSPPSLLKPLLLRPVFLFGMLLISFTAWSADWAPQEGAMLTEWGEKVTPENVWREYPRPQLVRENWLNLNGLWDFKTQKASVGKPRKWQQKILVPFVMESPLSGIGERLKEDEVIWYRKKFSFKPDKKGRTLLNFEGVDYFSTVWLNGKQVGIHKGGNLPFSFDVTSAVRSGSNELVVKVVDDTDSAGKYQLRGKQKRKNGGIWYSPSSGIWQTVWLEKVPATYIAEFKTNADMRGKLSVDAKISGDQLEASQLRVSVLEGGKTLLSDSDSGDRLTVELPNAKLWSPANPHLYDITVELLDAKGKVIDIVSSYVGFRSVGRYKNQGGDWRFTLNGKEIFHFGPLDQGWWPDGFLNPPSEQAYIFEMNYLKNAGFNMIRKHKKVEPRRYYYQADKIGLLVWQDQVSGGASGAKPREWPLWKRLEMLSIEDYPDAKRLEQRKGRWWTEDGEPVEADWPEWAHQQYMSELKSMIDTLHNHPSVVVWTAFNERWGQHRSMYVGQWIMDYDPTRYLNIASGGNFFAVGDIVDQHNYPRPKFPFDVTAYDSYIKVVGEFGGHGWPVAGHQWNKTKKKFVYGGMPKTLEEYINRYEMTANDLSQLKKQGVTAGVYTQTTDVEIEINGLITYDRKVIKIPAARLAEIHRKAGLTH